MTVRYILTISLLAALALCGCSPSFPSSYNDDGDDGVVRPNDRNVDDAPVLLSLSDPLYAVETRGAGSFDPWSLDSLHWKNAVMYVYAFATDNGIEGGADYYRDTLCLLNNQAARIQDEFGQLYLCSANGERMYCYYKQTQPNTRYKFFMYHVDDAPMGRPVYTGNTVSRYVSLDGTQDLIHAFAYPTETQSAQAAATLKMSESDAARYLYGYRAGLSGLNPILNVQHLLCQMDVCIVGQPVNTDEGKYRYQYQMMAVDDISFTAAKGGTLMVANDGWERDSYLEDVKNGKVFSPDHAVKEYKCQLRMNPMQNNAWTRLYNRDVDFDAVRQQMIDEGKISGSSVYYHLNNRSGVRDTLTVRPMLLPAQMEYVLDIGGYYADIDSEGNCVIRDLPLNPIRVASADGKGFLCGHHYTLILTMYGLQKIALSGLLDEWVEDGVVHVNTLNLQPL